MRSIADLLNALHVLLFYYLRKSADYRMFSFSGAWSQPVPYSADRTEVDTFLAGLTLPGSTGTNSEFIINFDDSDSDGERVQTQPAQVQPRSGVNRIGVAGDKSISRNLTPPNGNLETLRRRVGRTTGMSHNKTTVNTRAGTMVRPASVSKSPTPRQDTQIETLRQLIAVKESQINQSKRVSQLPESRSRAAAGGLIQGATVGTQKVGRTAGNPLAVNSASKTQFKKKPRISNLLHVDPRLSNIQANEAELSERGRGNVDALVSGKSSDHQVSTGPSEGTAAIEQADVAVLGAKESGISSFRSVEEVRNIAPSRGAVVIPAVAAAEPSRTGTSRGTAAAVSTEPGSSGIKLVESGRRNTSGVPVIDLGVTKPGNGESLQIAPKTTNTGETACIQSADAMPAGPPTQPGGNGPASSSVVSGERHLEPIRSEQAKGLSLKRRGEDSTEHQKKHQLDRSFNVIIQPSGRPGSDSVYLGNSISKSANHVVDLSADEDKLLAKRQRTGDHSPQVFSAAEHTAACLPSLSSLPERRSKAEFCPSRPSPTDQVEKCRGESRIRDPTNVPFSASNLRVDDQQSQKHKTLEENVSSKTADIPSKSTLRDSSGLHVQRPTSAHFSNSQGEDSQLIRNGENMSEMVNATPSRVLEAQETDNHHFTKVEGGGVSCGSLQPSRDLSNTNFVSTTDAAGIQIMNNDGIKMRPSAITSTHIVQSEVPDKLSLRDNLESAPNPGDPGGYNPWPALQRFEAGGSHLEHLSMQHTVVGGSAGHSLENLREEEDSVDKDLEEAQAHRRDCELRERELRRAYREAQIALSAANARCEALSQRRKYLSVQVLTAELHGLQQPSFSILSNNNSLVPFDPFNKITLPRNTEVPYPAYPSTVGVTAKPSTDHQLGVHRVLNKQEARILSSAQVDAQTLKVSSSSADTEILEENLGRTTHHGTRLSGGHIPSTEEATVGDKNALSDKDGAPHYVFCAEGEVSKSTNGESATSSQTLKIKKHTETIVSSDAAGQGELRLNNSVDLQDSSHEDKDPQNRSMVIHYNDISVPGSKDGRHTPFPSTSIGQMQAQVAETEVDKEILDAREIVSSTLKTDRGLLDQEETRTAFGSNQCVQIMHTPGQGPFEDSGEVIRVSNSTMQKPSTTGMHESHCRRCLLLKAGCCWGYLCLSTDETLIIVDVKLTIKPLICFSIIAFVESHDALLPRH